DSTDVIEFDYLLSRSLSKSLELGGGLGFLSTNPDQGNGHSGINDLTIAGKYRRPMGAESVSTTWIGEAGLSLPTGDSDNGLGAGGIGLLMGWGLETPLQLVTGYAHLGVRLYTEGNDTQFGNVFSYTLGARYEMDPRWNLACDLRGFNRGKDKINKVRRTEGVQELYLAPGTEWSPEQFPAVLSGTLLLGLSRDAYNWGLVAGIKF
ncbi:MAG TPA: hypothetical protein PK876_07040, partial [Elusimicrobiota bacterium]|nr:hypothetical protein [Elusimicrobiota bacterium]